LVFKKYKAKFDWQHKKGITESYMPTDIKNWRIQSLAGDIYKLWLAVVYKQSINNRRKWLLINTIHDSIILDCKPEYVDECREMLQNSIDNLINDIYTVYKVKFLVPIRCEISVGERWLEL